MKKTLALAVLAACAIAFTGTVVAAPFASKIAVANKSVAPAGTINVTYFLNVAADTVVVELLNAGGTVVATSTNGTKTAGANTASIVAPAAAGADYRVRVTATGTNAAPRIIKGLQSGNTTPYSENFEVGSLYTLTSPRAVWPVIDQNHDDFGRVIMNTCYYLAAGANNHSYNMSYDSALGYWYPGEVDKGRTTKENFGNHNTATTRSSVGMGGYFRDPADAGKGIYYFANDAAPNSLYMSNSLVTSDSFGVACSGTGVTTRGGVIFTANNGKTYSLNGWGTTFALAEFNAVVPPTRTVEAIVISGIGYARNVFMHGTKIFTIDRNSKKIYRYDKEYIAGLTEATQVAVGDSNPEVIYDTVACISTYTGTSAEGPIAMSVDSQGNLYAMLVRAANANGPVIVKLGTNADTGTKALGLADIYYPMPYGVNVIYPDFKFDAGDNMVIVDNYTESIFVVEPVATNKATAVKAPLSQNITVTTSVDDWSQF